MRLPLAHVGHYLWVLYVLPILIVVGAILRNAVTQRRTENAPPAGGTEGDAEDDPARSHPPP